MEGRKGKRGEAEEGEAAQSMTMEEVEEAWMRFLTCAGEDGCLPASALFPNLTREQRARVHALADEAGFVHFSFGNRRKRVLMVLRDPRPLSPGVYDKGSGKWTVAASIVDPNPSHPSLKSAPIEQLKIVTYNVLMDSSPGIDQYALDDILYTEYRWPALLEVLRNESADLIALQEVTPTFHEKLLQEEWLQDRYYISDLSGNSVRPMGNMLLSRYPFISVEERMYRQEHGMPKSVLLATVAVGSLRLSAAVVHLKAGTGYETTRKSQIEQTIQLQQAHEADVYLLLGDFNMRDIDNETNDQLEEAYVDLWQTTHGPIDPSNRGGSYTFDLNTNATAKCISDKVTAIKKTVGCSSRFDRIYLRSPAASISGPCSLSRESGRVEGKLSRIEATRMVMIGTEPVCTAPDGMLVFPSDHYGLAVTVLMRYHPAE